jgi:4'-phosphopantetheinyl transferase
MTAHVACARIGELLRQMPDASAWLSSSEQQRLHGINRRERRDQFLASRWQARTLLAQAVGGEATEWRLSAMPDAPPAVEGHAGLHLSVSHSGEWSACAIAESGIGLDLEAPQRQRDIAGLIALCCTPSEQALLAGEADAFYELWTVKEAWLKRRREWIAPSRLQQIEARHAEAADVRTWRGDGCTLALCGPASAHWWTPPMRALRGWQVEDRLSAA